MQPFQNEFTNQTLGAPKNWDPRNLGPCNGLPVNHTDGIFYSYWSLNWRERFKVLFGKPVRLAVVSNAHPPVMLDVEAA